MNIFLHSKVRAFLCMAAVVLFFACSNESPGDQTIVSSSSVGMDGSLSSSSDEELSSNSVDVYSSSEGTSSSSGESLSSAAETSSSSGAPLSSVAGTSSSSGAPLSSAAGTSSSSRASSSSGTGTSSSSSLAATPSKGTFHPEMLGLTPGATTASLNLNWISTNTLSTGGAQALVSLYNASGTLIETFSGKTATHTSGKRHHKATITGLTPNTSYKYSVSNNGTDWSYEYNYKTPPSGNVFTIAVVADAQITDGNQDSNTKPAATPNTVAQGWKSTVERIAATDASLIICNGDQVDEARTYTESQYMKFFAPDAMRSLPLSPTIGNHDLHAEFLNHFNMPNMTSTSSYDIYSGGINYYYLYNNILVVVLNTGSFPQKQSDADSYVAKYKKTMDAAKAAHAGQYDWLMVSYHKSTTSISSHACDKEMEYYVKAGLEKLITDSGVDVVLTGHDHILVRSHLMKWDNAKGHSVRSTDGKGAIYLTVSTASGGKFYPAFFILEPAANEYVSDYTEEHPVLVDGTKGWKEFGKVRGKIGSFTGAIDTNKIPLSVDYWVKGKNSYDYTPNYTPNYTIFEVNGKTIKAKTYGSIDNAVVDEYTLTPRGVR